MSDIAVVGAGAWGTALAIHAARAGHRVALWARNPAQLGVQSARLPGFDLPPAIRVIAALPEEADAVLVAVPMQHLARVLAGLSTSAPLLLCCKGLEAGTGLLPLEVAARARPGAPAAVLTGPNFAREIAACLPAAAVVAAADAALRERLIGLLAGDRFRLYGNADVMGAQLGGAAKNVFAIAAGVVIGAGLGENARAALVTRGLAELARLCAALGGRAETVFGLSGMGDLVLTCTGARSRNFSLGLALGQGGALPDLLPEGGPAVEGVATAPALLARAAGVELPVCEAVVGLLGGEAVGGVIGRLMGRPLRHE